MSTDRELIRNKVTEVFDSFHDHTCLVCKGAGCINCRDTGQNQTPCLVCDEDGIAYKRRKKHIERVLELLTEATREARIDELKRLQLDDEYLGYIGKGKLITKNWYRKEIKIRIYRLQRTKNKEEGEK